MASASPELMTNTKLWNATFAFFVCVNIAQNQNQQLQIKKKTYCTEHDLLTLFQQLT